MNEHARAEDLGLEITSIRHRLNELARYEGCRRAGNFPPVDVNDFVVFSNGACVVITELERWQSGAMHWRGVQVSVVTTERTCTDTEIAAAIAGMCEILEATGEMA